jgi:tetratricopeptide (TPR) repeat protein
VAEFAGEEALTIYDLRFTIGGGEISEFSKNSEICGITLYLPAKPIPLMEPSNKHSEIRKLIEEGDYENAFRQFIAKKPDSALTEEAERLYARFSQNEKDHIKQLTDDGQWWGERVEIVNDLVNLLDKADAPPTSYISFVRRPPLVAHQVLGRKEDLKVIADCFEQGDHLLLLNGMGGVGKSTLAGFYMERMGHLYRHIGWVRYTGNLANDLARDLTDQVALGFSEDLRNNFDRLDPETKFDTLMRHMERLSGPNLLIVDNLNTLEDAEDVAARSLHFPHGWKLLITAREHNDGMPHHSVGVLNLEDARKLFLRYCPQTSNEHTQLDSLLEHVGRHTLVVEFLAKTTKAQGWTPEKMLARLKAQGLTHLSTNATVATAHAKNQRQNMVAYISALFDINLSTLNQNERWLLANLAMLPNFAHAYSVLEEMLFFEDEYTKKNERFDKDDLYPLLNDLTAKGYLEKLRTRRPTHPKLEEPAPEEDGFYMHPVMGEVVRDKEKLSIEKLLSILGYFIEMFHRANSLTNPAFVSPWLAYGDALASYLPEHGLLGALANNLMVVHFAQANFSSALKWQLKSVEIREKTLPKDHPHLAQSYNNLALIYNTLDDFSMALKSIEKAIVIRKKQLPEESEELAESYVNISSILMKQDNLNEAMEWLIKAIEIQDKIPSYNRQGLAISYSNLSKIYLAKVEIPLAIEWQQKANSILEKTCENNHPLLAMSYNNSSLIYKAQGDLDTALLWQQKAIAIQERVLGENHPDRAQSYWNMAGILDAMDNPTKALPFIQRAVGIFQRSLPEGHSRIENALSWLEGIQARAEAAGGTNP